MGPVKHQERKTSCSDLSDVPGWDEEKMAVMTVPRAALSASGVAPQVGDLQVATIAGVDRAVIVFQLTDDHAVVVDVT